MRPLDNDAVPDPCTACELGRRDFVKRATFAMIAVGTAGSRLAALPVHAIDAIGAQGNSLTYPIPAGDSVNIDRKNDTIVARVGGKVFVFSRDRKSVV